MGVRLLNAPSPSLPTLSEIRRFSHTMGVLRLALLNPHVGLSQDEVRALTASILIHDAATPPFAHLLEYYLKDRDGWNHEAALPDLLTGHQFVSNTSHQILPGEELKFKRLCDTSKINFDLVMQIVRKQHRASNLLFGTLDFDNIDNVLRMAWALGFNEPNSTFLQLARELSVSIDGNILLSEKLNPSVKTWSSLRRRVYDVLVFDAVTVSVQAVLTRAISLLFEADSMPDIRWASRDSDLLDLLARSPRTKHLMLRHFNELPAQLFALRLHGSLSSFGFSSRDQAIKLIERIAIEEFGIKRPFGYAFIDKSAFSKRLNFIDPATRVPWSFGESSESVVFYCFASLSDKQIAKQRIPFCNSLMKVLGRSADTNVDAVTKDGLAS
jgi:HD superfamily phosphohydrolase